MRARILLLLVLLIGLVSSAFAAEKPTTAVTSPNGTCTINRGHYVWNCWNKSDKILSFAAYKKATCAMNGKHFRNCTKGEFEVLPAGLELRVPCNVVVSTAILSPTKPADTVPPQVLEQLKGLQLNADALVHENEDLRKRVEIAEQKVVSLQLHFTLEQAQEAQAGSVIAASKKEVSQLRSERIVLFVLCAVFVAVFLWRWYFADRKDELERKLGGSAEMMNYAERLDVTLDELLRSMVTKKWPYNIKGRKFDLDVAGYDKNGPVITFPDCPDYTEDVPLKEVRRALLVCIKMFEGTGITREDILHLPEPE